MFQVARSSWSSEREIESALSTFEQLMRGVNTTDAALRMIDEDILGLAAAAVGTEFGDRPLTEARLRHTIGTTYTRLGLHPTAESHLRAALEIRERELGSGHPETLQTTAALAELLFLLLRYKETESLYLATLEGRRRVLGGQASVDQA